MEIIATHVYVTYRYSTVLLTCDVGSSFQVPKLLLNLGLEEPLVHATAQITDRGMVGVSFPHLCSSNAVFMPFASRTAILKFCPTSGCETEF